MTLTALAQSLGSLLLAVAWCVIAARIAASLTVPQFAGLPQRRPAPEGYTPEEEAFLMRCIADGERELDRLLASGGMNVDPAVRSRMGALT